MVGVVGTTPSWVRLGFVYTPPESRRRGYAGACVGALCERMLAEGRRYCHLNADAANPTSNELYLRLGFQRAADFQEFVFTG